jgi:hypothetical protein
MNKVKEAPVPRNLKKFLSLITDQLFCIDDDIVVLTEPQLKKAKFSYDDIQFFLNAMSKHKLYSALKRRYDFNFLPVPKNPITKERMLSSWNWQMGFSDKLIEVRYFIKITSREALYEFCGLPLEERKLRGKTTKRGFKTSDVFIESRSQDQDEDHHILIGDRSGKNEKAHIIVDGKTGEQRVEDGRGEPTDTAPHIETIVTLRDGKKIKTTRSSIEELSSIETGRSDIKNTKEFEVAYNLRFSVLKLRDAIRGVRNPAIWIPEFNTAKKHAKGKNPDLTDEYLEKNSSILVYEMRWEEINKALKELEPNLLAAEVLWGPEIVGLVRGLNKKITELNIALQQNFNPDFRTKNILELHDIIYDIGDSDNFNTEVNEVIKKVDEYIKSKVPSA